ncbi:MAG: DUF1145 domain-containing protein [Arsenophonus sp. NEOnobi-MAG3]
MPVESLTAFIFVINNQLGNIISLNPGKLLMLFVWGLMMFNFIHLFPKPLKCFIDLAMICIILYKAFLETAFAKTEKHPR